MIGFSPSPESVADVRNLFATEPVHEAFDGFAKACLTLIMAENLVRGQERLHKGISNGTLLPLGVGRQVNETLIAASYDALDGQDSQATTLRRVVSGQQGVLTSRVARELFGDRDPSLAKGPRYYQGHLERLAVTGALEHAVSLPNDDDGHVHSPKDVRRYVLDQAGLTLSGLRLLDQSLRQRTIQPVMVAHFHNPGTVEAIVGYCGGSGLRNRHEFSGSIALQLYDARNMTAAFDDTEGFGSITDVSRGATLEVPVTCLSPVVQLGARELYEDSLLKMGQIDGRGYPHTVVVTGIDDRYHPPSRAANGFAREATLTKLVERAQGELNLVA